MDTARSTNSESAENSAAAADQEIPQWRKLQTRSSTVFGKIMGDIEIKMQDRLRKQHEALMLRQKQEQEARNNGVVMETIQDDVEEDLDLDLDEDEEEEVVDPHTEKLRRTARNAWRLIKRYINEQRMKNKNQKSGMNWSFLKQTLSNMTNMEKAREEMYKKYLYNEDPREWTKGLSNVPDHIFQKARAAGGKKQEPEKKATTTPRQSNTTPRQSNTTQRPAQPSKRNSKGKGSTGKGV